MKTRLLLAAVVLAAGVANADTFSVDLSTVFSGATPPGSSPWGTATFTDVNNTFCSGSLLGCVELTMTGNLQNASNFITEWDFNVAQTGLTGLTITANTLTAGVTAPTIDPYSSNAYKADGDGFYDFGFQYTSAAAGRFTGTDSATFYITGVGTAITFASFNTPSENSQSLGAYVTAAHIQGITSGSQTCSGWVGGVTNVGTAKSGPSGDCLPSVPEPLHSGLFLTSGLIGFVVLARKRLFGQA